MFPFNKDNVWFLLFQYLYFLPLVHQLKKKCTYIHLKYLKMFKPYHG